MSNFLSTHPDIAILSDDPTPFYCQIETKKKVVHIYVTENEKNEHSQWIVDNNHAQKVSLYWTFFIENLCLG